MSTFSHEIWTPGLLRSTSNNKLSAQNRELSTNGSPLDPTLNAPPPTTTTISNSQSQEKLGQSPSLLILDSTRTSFADKSIKSSLPSPTEDENGKKSADNSALASPITNTISTASSFRERSVFDEPDEAVSPTSTESTGSFFRQLSLPRKPHAHQPHQHHQHTSSIDSNASDGGSISKKEQASIDAAKEFAKAHSVGLDGQKRHNIIYKIFHPLSDNEVSSLARKKSHKRTPSTGIGSFLAGAKSKSKHFFMSGSDDEENGRDVDIDNSSNEELSDSSSEENNTKSSSKSKSNASSPKKTEKASSSDDHHHLEEKRGGLFKDLMHRKHDDQVHHGSPSNLPTSESTPSLNQPSHPTGFLGIVTNTLSRHKRTLSSESHSASSSVLSTSPSSAGSQKATASPKLTPASPPSASSSLRTPVSGIPTSASAHADLSTLGSENLNPNKQNASVPMAALHSQPPPCSSNSSSSSLLPAPSGITRSISDSSLCEKYGKPNMILGRGANAVVRLAHKIVEPSSMASNASGVGSSSDEEDSGKLFAVKEFRRRRKDESQREYVKKLVAEFCISSSLHHENVVETVDLIQDEGDNWCEVMEFCAGGDLYSRLHSGDLKESTEINCLFKQLVNGVAYLHEMGVAHRDLKPENLLIEGNGRILKITDFGVSEVFRAPFEKAAKKAKGICGSTPYIAPEEFEPDAEYDPTKVDVWAIGIIYYVMIYHSVPWKQAVKSDPHYRYYLQNRCKNFWPIDRMAPGPRKLMYQLLDPDPVKRYSIAQILDDDWVKSIEYCCHWKEADGPDLLDTETNNVPKLKKVRHAHCPIPETTKKIVSSFLEKEKENHHNHHSNNNNNSKDNANETEPNSPSAPRSGKLSRKNSFSSGLFGSLSRKSSSTNLAQQAHQPEPTQQHPETNGATTSASASTSRRSSIRENGSSSSSTSSTAPVSPKLAPLVEKDGNNGTNVSSNPSLKTSPPVLEPVLEKDPALSPTS